MAAIASFFCPIRRGITFGALLFLFLGPSLFGNGTSLVISEFSAASDGSFPDEDGDASDWIEIRNVGADDVALDGYWLTDDADNLTRWRFPPIDLQAGAVMIVFASGKDWALAEGELHTNFSLSEGGEYLALTGQNGSQVLCEFAPQFPRQFRGLSFGSANSDSPTTQALIESPAEATWFVPTSDIGESWQDVGFDDSTWNVAQTGIGYGSGYETSIGAGGDVRAQMQGVNECAYLRVPFQIGVPLTVETLTLSMLFEDGFSAYLNGELVASENAPAELRYNSRATASGEVDPDDVAAGYTINFAGKLMAGENILAIHLLNDVKTSSDVLVVPELHAVISAGGERIGGYFATPSPGVPNLPVDFTDFVRDTRFDVDRGFFDAPFDLHVSCATPGATIVYTTDGNSPTLTNGNTVSPADENTAPGVTLNISGTTVLRVAAFKEGFKSTNIDTQTYLFLEDVLDQTDTPLPGYPLPWVTRNGTTIDGDYGMDPDIVGPVYSREELKGSLNSLPTISIVTDIANLFDQQIGIQVNPQDAGPESERPVSVEMIGFPDGLNIQTDAGMRMNGNASRSPTRPKHNFRIIYRNEYGTGRLEYPLFGGGAQVGRFNQFILRGGNGNSWIHPSASVYNNAMYIRDQWFRDAHTAMGYPEALQSEVHVYFNGLYWGMHHLFERIEEEWTAERFGGGEDDWEGFRIVGGNRIEIIKGTPAEESAGMLDSWQAAIDAANAQDLIALQEYIDLDALIDYLLLNFHAGNNDWDGNNVRAMRRTNPPGKYMWFCHDAERAGFNAPGTININVTNKNTPRAPTGINTAMRSHPDYAIRFADRAYKHLFNGGALTPENGISQWSARAERIREAMKAESARWGDFRSDSPLTLVQWEAALQREYNDWFPFRTPVIISQLRATGLYPDIDPPTFSQQGGMVADGFELVIDNELGSIYFTADGSDPRLLGGGINPTATEISGATVEFDILDFGADWRYEDSGADLGTTWRTNSFVDTGWTVGSAPLGYGNVTNTTISTLVNSQRHVTTYFRREFQLTDADLITAGSLEINADGGAVVYLNGAEIAREDMPSGAVGFSSFATNESAEGVISSYAFAPSLLLEGSNTIAVEVHQGSAASSDMAFDLAIAGIRLNESESAIPIMQTTTVRTRSRTSGGEWSALNEATFLTGTPATAGNLVVSKIHYNPSDAKGELSEFVELMNISGETLDLGGLSFSQGIDFTFTTDLTLAPGARILVVADLAEFEAAHGANMAIAGVFSGRLDNGGEQLTLLSANGATIQSFTFDDRAPWPREADGDGYSLVLISPETAPDHSLAINWRASVDIGGSAGASDSTMFTGDPATELLDYALGEGQVASIEMIEGVPVFRHPRRLGADDIEYTIEVSSDLKAWTTSGTRFLGHAPRLGQTGFSLWEISGTNIEELYARLIVSVRQ